MILLVRLLHGAITAFFLTCIAYIYWCAIRGRRTKAFYGVIGAIAVEGAVVGLNGGDCPLGGVHRRVGDERTFFELFLPHRYAKRAVPLFTLVTLLGIAAAFLPNRHKSMSR